ncbi:hypothetical protein JET18_19835 [Chryseobacterium sp. L7]|uniref:DUF3592 domain-containing protein n=1 Tax=Chryseobacterium endalhagicum TaxID=2797638 RepID=A0ABS1QKG0_9FLAO|nr:hypothetical protein [Chryseobacterium endalhagicum]MBL1223105.1 hypothetical protein [Chryseobacterium endalhagicum]
MMRVKEFNIQKAIALSGFIYFLYSIGLTAYDAFHLKRENWTQAENQSTVYSSRRSTIVTYNFVRNNIRISREYPGILEGINTWMWGINKENDVVDISFFIKEKDYHKIKNNKIRNRHDIFGGKLNELEAIPFFGLREINIESNKFLLILDIWKYNYSILFAFFLIILPYILFFILKKVFKIEIEKNQDKVKQSEIGGYMILSFIILIINLIV